MRGTVSTHPNGTLSAVLRSRFPFTLGRVDWRFVPGSTTKEESPIELDRDTEVDHAVAFLLQCLESAKHDPKFVAVVGDNTDEEYEVLLSDLPELLRDIDKPEHKYVFALDGSWCLLWSLEGQLGFGIAPTQLPPRRRT